MPGKRSLLNQPSVSKSHWASGALSDEMRAIHSASRCVIRLISAKDLLASDADTGKSDPACFVWFGRGSDAPSFDEPWDEESIAERGIIVSATQHCTLEPIWNEDVYFPIDLSEGSLTALIETKFLLVLKDEDFGEDGKPVYENLGFVELSFKDHFLNSKLKNGNAIADIASWHTLKPWKGMKKVMGQIKLSISLIFEADAQPLLKNRECANFKELYDLILKTLKPDSAHSGSANLSNGALNTSRSLSPLLTGRSQSAGGAKRVMGNTSRSTSTPRIGRVRPLSAGGSERFILSNSVEGLLQTTIPEVQEENDEDGARAELAEWKKLTELAMAENGEVFDEPTYLPPAGDESVPEPELELPPKSRNKKKDDKRTLKFTVTDFIIEGLEFISADTSAQHAMAIEDESKDIGLTFDADDKNVFSPMETNTEIISSGGDLLTVAHESEVQLSSTLTGNDMKNFSSEDIASSSGDLHLKEHSPQNLSETTELLIIPESVTESNDKVQEHPVDASKNHERSHSTHKKKTSTPPTEVVELNWSVQVGDAIKAGNHPQVWPSAPNIIEGSSAPLQRLTWNNVNHEFTVVYPSSSSSDSASPVFPIAITIFRPSSEILLFQSSKLVATGTAIFPAMNSRHGDNEDEPLTAKLCVKDLLFVDEYKNNVAIAKHLGDVQVFICLSWVPPPIEISDDPKKVSATSGTEIKPKNLEDPEISLLRSKVAQLEMTVVSLNEQLKASPPGSPGFFPGAGDEALPDDTIGTSKLSIPTTDELIPPAQSDFQLPQLQDDNKMSFTGDTRPVVGDNFYEAPLERFADDDEIYDDLDPSLIAEPVNRSNLRLPLDRIRGGKSSTVPSKHKSKQLLSDKGSNLNPNNKEKAQNNASGGNVGTVRALKELAEQRKKLEKALSDIKKTTRESIGKLTKRIQDLESGTGPRKQLGYGPQSGDEALPPGSDGEDPGFQLLTKTRKEKEREALGIDNSDQVVARTSLAGSGSSSQEKLLSKTTPGRIESKALVKPGMFPSLSSNSPTRAESDFDWNDIASRMSTGDILTCFDHVIRSGTLDDLSRLMEMLGPRPELLSVSIRNRLFEGVSLMLNNKTFIERNLVWVLALVRTGLIDTLVRHTQHDIMASLLRVASEPSKRGMLAALLEEAIRKQQAAGNSNPL